MPSALCKNNPRIDFFEKTAPYYDLILDLLTLKQYTEFLKRAIEVLAPQSGERILDLGSGTGRAAFWMTHAVGEDGEVVGMDLSKAMIEIAKRRYGGSKGLVFIHKDVTQPWEYQNYFDGIVSSFTLHEIQEKKRLSVLKHCYMALKEKGRMVIADFNPKGSGIAHNLLSVFFKLFERENLNFFSFDQEDLLKRTGFKKIEAFSVLAGVFQITLALRKGD
ncbi:MAG: methyltransferase domain-containing protein [Thermodesulfobacteriota bacterium]